MTPHPQAAILKAITINGHEVPAPERSAPRIESVYYSPTTANPKELSVKLLWNNRGPDRVRLSAGVVHLTKEAAIAHAEALLSFTRSDKCAN